MQCINPYLNFPGNTEEAFNFYRSVFGGEFASVARFKDAPDTAKMPEADRNKIMHIALPIGNGSVLMGTDVVGAMSQGFHEGQLPPLRRHREQGGGGQDLPGALRRWEGEHADAADLLGILLRDAQGQVRDPVDGQLRPPEDVGERSGT